MKYTPWPLALALSLGTLVLTTGAHAQDREEPGAGPNPRVSKGPIAPKLDGLGNHHHTVTTASAEAQAFFDQSLALLYAFNHQEALRAFREVTRLDPGCAMGYWGQAYALGPHLNQMMQDDNVEPAHSAIVEARQHMGAATEKEKAFIEALARRYSDKPVKDRSSYDQAYADAMGDVYRRYPLDDDAATLYAAALMNLMPWDYWTPDGQPKERTPVVMNILETVIDRNPKHAGAHHYYIHLTEARHPEKGEKSADLLTGLMPGAGHIVHMPSHIYMRVGRYADAYEANRLAIEADEDYITQCRQQGIYPLAYYPHNVHFLAWAAQRQGKSAEAIEAARKVARKAMEAKAGAHFALYESFYVMPLYMLTRFGQWDAILEEPQPDESAPFVTGIWRYARGMAYMAKGKMEAAKEELAAVREQAEASRDAEVTIGFTPPRTLLTIAGEILAGQLASAAGDYDAALLHTERAVRLEDSLAYNEPPDWYFPVRHALGKVLLDAGRPEEAATVYWVDLRNHPENPFSLFGLRQALEAQGKSEQAAAIQQRFDKVWAEADHELTHSLW